MTVDTDESSAEQQLGAFLAKYDPPIQHAARAVRASLQALVPGAVELVYDNYNGLVIGFGPTERPSEAILSILLQPKWVTLCFLRGVNLPDPHGLLRGSGNQVRNIRLMSPGDLEAPPVLALIREAVLRSEPAFDPAQDRRLIMRSVSAKQRPRRPKS
jgi:hypothetical protein